MKRIYRFLIDIFHVLAPKTCIECDSLLEKDEKMLCSSCKELLLFDNFLNQEYFAPLTPYALSHTNSISCFSSIFIPSFSS